MQIAANNSDFDQYRLVGKPLSENQGSVYEAIDIRQGKRVVLRYLTAAQAQQNPDAVARLFREAKVLSTISHENVVSLLDYGTSQDRPYLVMEYVDGYDLHDLKQLHRAIFSIKDVSGIATQLCSGLQVCHSKGILHRDIKPKNIMRGKLDDRIVLVDFGIVKLTWEETHSGFGQMGSLRYMSPEQVGDDPLTPASDLFSVAIILYELLVGTHPFDHPSPTKVSLNILSKNPLPPSQHDASVGALVDEFFAKALDKDAGRRFQSGSDFCQAFLRAIEHQQLGGSLAPMALDHLPQPMPRVSSPPSTSQITSSYRASPTGAIGASPSSPSSSHIGSGQSAPLRTWTVQYRDSSNDRLQPSWLKGALLVMFFGAILFGIARWAVVSQIEHSSPNMKEQTSQVSRAASVHPVPQPESTLLAEFEITPFHGQRSGYFGEVTGFTVLDHVAGTSSELVIYPGRSDLQYDSLKIVFGLQSLANKPSPDGSHQDQGTVISIGPASSYALGQLMKGDVVSYDGDGWYLNEASQQLPIEVRIDKYRFVFSPHGEITVPINRSGWGNDYLYSEYLGGGTLAIYE